MTIRTIWVNGEVPYTKNFGTLAELLALDPSTEFAEGFASDHGRIDWVKGSGWMSGGKLLSSDGSISFAGPVLDSQGNPIGEPAPKKSFADLWDPATQIPANQTIDSYIDSHGVLHTASGWLVSAMIPVVAGQIVYLTTLNTAPVFAGAYFLADGSPAPSDPRYNEHNRVPAGVTGMRINMESSWTSPPIVLVMETGTTKKKFQFLGDSITRGFGLAVTAPFPETACGILGADVVNSGVDGSTMANGVGASNPMVLRLSEIDLSVDGHVITYGTNDCRYGTLLGAASDTGDSTFYGAYLRIIDYIRKYAPQSRILLVTPAHYGAGSNGTPASGQSAATFAAAVKDIGKINSCPVIDLDGECGIDLRMKAHQDMYGDEGHDLHFSQNGYTAIGHYVAAKMKGFGVA